MAMPNGSLFSAHIRWGGVFSGSRESLESACKAS